MLIFFFATFKPLTYNKTYEYPPYAQGLGMCMAFASMICIPLTALYRIARARGTLAERWAFVTTPRNRPKEAKIAHLTYAVIPTYDVENVSKVPTAMQNGSDHAHPKEKATNNNATPMLSPSDLMANGNAV
ncbi:sodium- and chloride-dependent creatine transporter 1-like [Lingula anatina]|nr:sodium- and chloride-dependent creatine transporter 1-like [Lingula anatina]|eukprot:XP_013383902.1 sodium- and chloride-dependent creatine transporter 1-like [Lingula anatina]